jgi:hypothetical protein
MSTNALISKRFAELADQMATVRPLWDSHGSTNPGAAGVWQRWATSALDLLERTFGREAAHSRNFIEIYQKPPFIGTASEIEAAKGVFSSAKADFEAGYTVSLEAALSAEIFGDFVVLAKHALSEGQKDVAAVLACAALEDTLKRFAARNGLDVGTQSLQSVVAALKSKGLVSGAQKSLLDAMPKIRDYAMHANWDKLTAADVSSVIGFVEQFLLTHF